MPRSALTARLHRAAAFALILQTTIAHAATTTFDVTVPESTPGGELVYIAGNFQAWNPGDPAYALTEQPGGTWQITLELPDGEPIEYKFTRGTWETVEKGPRGEEIANRTYTPNGTETLELVVESWADIPVSTITGHVEWFEYKPFLAGRRCWVYLPPDYFVSADSYPVLYMHDGQNLFDALTSFAGEWEVDEACEALISAGEIEPIIVVGIENSDARIVEYTPWPGVGGDVYLTAIRDALIPEVDVRYRTTGEAYMSGSSLGGLISAFAGYAYDDVFTRIGAVSPSYWWDNDHMVAYAEGAGRPDLERFYHDMGTIESGQTTDQDGNGVDDNIDDLREMQDVLLAQGFVPGDDFMHVEAQGHQHNEYWWAQRVPDMLRFLIDPPAVAVPGAAPSVLLPRLIARPNPLRTGTSVGFALRRAARIRVDLFDAAGRHLRRLAVGHRAAGAWSVSWDGRTASGRPAAPGTYWVRLDADGGPAATARIVRVP